MDTKIKDELSKLDSEMDKLALASRLKKRREYKQQMMIEASERRLTKIALVMLGIFIFALAYYLGLTHRG